MGEEKREPRRVKRITIKHASFVIETYFPSRPLTEVEKEFLGNIKDGMITRLKTVKGSEFNEDGLTESSDRVE